MVSISQVSRLAPHASSKSSGAPALATRSSCAADGSVTAREPSPRASNHTSRSVGQPFLAHDAVNTNRAGSPLVVGQDV